MYYGGLARRSLHTGITNKLYFPQVLNQPNEMKSNRNGWMERLQLLWRQLVLVWELTKLLSGKPLIYNRLVSQIIL